MTSKAGPRRWWITWGLLFGAFTLVGLLFASRTYVLYSFYPERSISLGEALIPAVGDWWLWALLAPGMLWLVRRRPILSSGWRRALAIHLLAGVLVATLKYWIDFGATHLVGWRPAPSFSVPAFIFQFYSNLATYWVIIAVGHALDYARRYRDRQIRASQLEAKLAQVQLEVLRMQLQPHFLFNTLHAISTLMHRDPNAADRMLVRLSDLLRLTIEKIGVHEVSLKEELDFLRSYLDIEQIRFQDRLAVDLAVQPEVLDARVPNLLLQPLVENSIRHGLAPRLEPGRIEVRAERVDGNLLLTVRDDGPGLPEGGEGSGSHGLGLSNIRARLAQLYGSAHSLEMRNHPDGGLMVTISIPYRVDRADDDGESAESQ